MDGRLLGATLAILDILLTSVLVAIIPAYKLWRSVGTRTATPANRELGYLKAIGLAVALLAALTWLWATTGRPAGDLGLSLTPRGEFGLFLAILLLGGFLGYLGFAKPSATSIAAEPASMMPSTPRETALFLVTMAIIGPAWEVLFRGYLLWSLGGWIGTWPAVVVAATAYGAAHGYKSRHQFIGSLVSALAFTSGYALTHSLWWLMLIHVGLPWVGVLRIQRQRAAQALA